MYEQYTRTYTYKGQNNYSGARSVKWNRFTISGDTTHTIGQIVRIEYVHAHSSINRPTRTLRGRIVLTDGTAFISSPDSYAFKGDVHRYTNVWESDFPTADQFAMIDRIETINEHDETNNASYGSSPLYWRANSDDPMIVRVTFVEEPPIRYSPKVESFVVGRCNAQAQMVDDGAYISTTMRLSYDTTKELPENTSVIIRYSGGEVNVTNRLAELISPDGLNFDTTLIPGVFATGAEWVFTVEFTMGKEVATAADSVGTTYAPFFISRDGQRLSFNGFPRQMSGQSAEFHAPVYFYGGTNATSYPYNEEPTGSTFRGRPIYRAAFETTITASGRQVVGTLAAAPQLVIAFGGSVGCGRDGRIIPINSRSSGEYQCYAWVDPNSREVNIEFGSTYNGVYSGLFCWVDYVRSDIAALSDEEDSEVIV